MAQTVLTSPIIFMGAYVTSFNATFGFNTTPSTLNLTLVSVPGEAEFITTQHPVGSFRSIDLSDFGDSQFKFGGILTSKVEQQINIGGNTWEIQLTDPRIAMKAVTLVLSPNPGGFGDGTSERVVDVYNAFKDPENSSTNVSSVGGPGINVADILVAAGLSDAFIPTVANITIDPPGFVARQIWGTTYTFRFPGSALASNFKISGDTITVLDLIQQIADGNAFDWFVETTGDSWGATVQIIPISRRQNNTDISLDEFIAEVNGGDTLTEKASAGIELRQDNTGSIVYSDRVEFMDAIGAASTPSAQHYSLPISDIGTANPSNLFGSTSDSIQPHRIQLPIDPGDFTPITLEDQAGYVPEDDELRAAMAGFDNWLLYLGFVRNHPIASNAEFFTNLVDYENGFSDEDITDEFWISTAATARIKKTRSVGFADLQRMAYDSSEFEFIRNIRYAYDAVRQAAQETYGRTYKFTQRQDADVVGSASTRTVEISTFDGGQLGMQNFKKGFDYNLKGEDRPVHILESIAASQGANLIVDTFFDDGSGKGRTSAYVFFDGVSEVAVQEGKFAISESPDNIIFADAGMYAKASISNGLIKVAPVYDLESTPCVANDLLAEAMLAAEGLSINECIDPTNVLKDAVSSFCDDLINDATGRYKMGAIAKIPSIAYIPYKHKRNVYQVYSSLSVGSQTYGSGPITVERDESLNPANFNTFDNMDDAGFAKVIANSSPIKDMEAGNITGVGLPIKSLGDSVGLNANITNVSITFGIDGIRTSYQLESFIKRYGKRDKFESDAFAKVIQQINKNIVSTNSIILNENKERIKIIDDVRDHILSKYTIFADISNPFGCSKILNFDNPDDDLGNRQKKKAGPKTAFIATDKGPTNSSKLKSNIPETQLDESTSAIAPNIWKKSYGTDISMLIVGFKMEGSLEDGGEETFIATGIPGPGDMNPYKLVLIDGKNTAPFKQIVYGDTPVEGGGFDINKIRGMALRMPLILSGWGFDTDGNPTFASEADKLDSSTWKTAPVDLRFDATRNLWIPGGAEVATGNWKRWDV